MRPRSAREAVLLAIPWLALAALPFLRVSPAEPATGAAPDDAAELGGDPPVPTDGRLTVVVVGPDSLPLEGARIEVRGAHGTETGETGNGGRARLDGLPRGEAVVLAWFGDLARGHAPVMVGPERTRIRIALEPGAALAGIVVDEAAEPVARALVEARSSADESAPPWTATTDDAGRFALDALVRGPQLVEVIAAGYERIGQSFDSRTDEEIRIVLRRTGAIGGRVTGVSGDGLGGAEIVLVGSGVWPPRSAESGPDGNFSFDGVPAGIYEVRARKDDLVADPREGISLAPGGRLELELHLAPGQTLAGRVVARDGDTPIEGAEVVVSEDSLSFLPLAVTTDADGRFVRAGLRDLEHHVSVHAAGYVPARAVARPGGEELTFTLVRAGIVEGVVLDAYDRPVAGVSVEVAGTGDDGEPVAWSGADATFSRELFAAELAGATPVLPSGELGVTLGAVPPLPIDGVAPAPSPSPTEGTPESSTEASPTFVTDEQGRFRIEGVPPGRLQVLGTHPGHAPGITPVFVLTAGATVSEVTLVLPEGGRIDGRVVDERGHPVSLARVEIHCEREPFARWILAGDDGRFELDGALGTTVLTAHVAGRPAARATVDRPAGETVEVELRIEGELTALRARTVDERGFPVAGVRVTARSLRPGADGIRSAWSGDDGTIEIPGIAPPPWHIEADHEGYAPLVRGNVRTEAEVTLALERGASIVGRAVDGWSGEPVVGASVELSGRGSRSALTDAGGAFELSRVPAGDYTVRIAAEGLLVAEVAARIAAQRFGVEDADVGDVPLEAGGSVAGDVVDALGDPVAGAEVAAGAPVAWERAVRTGPDGAFRITGLAPGPAVLTARHAAAGRSEPTAANVRARDETPGVRLRLPERFDPARVASDPGAGRHTGVAVEVREREDTVRITSVRAGSSAERAGVRTGDVLLAIDDAPVAGAEHARAMLRGPAGVEVLLDLQRGGRDLRLAVLREAWSE